MFLDILRQPWENIAAYSWAAQSWHGRIDSYALPAVAPQGMRTLEVARTYSRFGIANDGLLGDPLVLVYW